MQARIAVAEMIHLQVLDWFNDNRRDEMNLIADAAKCFQRIEKQRRGRTKQISRLSGYDAPVRQFHCRGRRSGQSSHLKRRCDYRAVMYTNTGFFHEQFNADNLFLVDSPLTLTTKRGIVPAKDLLTGGLSHSIVINNTVACHIHTHIRRGFIRAFAHDLFKHCCDDRENFYIPVIVDGCLTVSLKVERVDHVDIVKVSSSRFIGQIDRVFQGQIPNRKGFKFGITGFDTAFVFMIQLRKTGCHLSASRTGSGNDYQLTGRLNVLVFAVTLIAYDFGNIRRIPLNGIMTVNFNPKGLQTLLKRFRCRLILILG